MTGHNQRWQNGFDCQGLWVEVEVEKELGFTNKRDIEQYGIAEFVQRCKERVLKFARVISEQSIRLGQWMDWGDSYFTMSDENNYTIWRMIKTCHERGWLYRGHDVMPWCPRCGTGISHMEIETEGYTRGHPHQPVRALAAARPSEREPAGVDDHALDADVQRRRRGPPRADLRPRAQGRRERLSWPSRWSRACSATAGKSCSTCAARRCSTGATAARSTSCPRRRASSTASSRGPKSARKKARASSTSRPGCGEEDFRARQGVRPAGDRAARRKRRLRRRLRLADGPGRRRSRHADHRQPARRRACCSAPQQYSPPLPALLALRHRAGLPPGGRVVHQHGRAARDDDGRHPPDPLDPRVRPGARAGLAAQHARLDDLQEALLGSGAADLVLRRLPAHRSRRRPRRAADSARSRVGPSSKAIRRTGRGSTRSRSPAAAAASRSAASRTSATRGSTRASCRFRRCTTAPTRTTGGSWFPADFITESFPGQYRNWFYSLLVMSTVLENKPPFKTVLGHGTVRGEDGKPMHKSAGNAIDFNDAADRAGADVMRWIFCLQNPAAERQFRLEDRRRDQAPPAQAVGQLQVLRPVRRRRAVDARSAAPAPARTQRARSLAAVAAEHAGRRRCASAWTTSTRWTPRARSRTSSTI